ncbi:LysR substrate-binding domain-containing protein [Streptomyces sp. NPDC005423]|uniref:LysR substrate-binding domain-containing protein n=1 Tax=Streptomyces sp. NPDC005423 TaxID=3155343 RepID=UPI0033AF11F5
MRAAQDTLRGTVDVGAMASVEGWWILSALLGHLPARHPAIDVRLRRATTGPAGLAHALLSGNLGVAFLSLPEHKPAGIDAREPATVPLVLVVSAAHPLAQRGKVALADLAGELFVDFPPGYGNREVVDRAFAVAGVVRRVALEVPDIDMGAALVARRDLPGSNRGRATHPPQLCDIAAHPTAAATDRTKVLTRHQPGPPSTIFHTRVATWRFSRSSTFARSLPLMSRMRWSR